MTDQQVAVKVILSFSIFFQQFLEDVGQGERRFERKAVVCVSPEQSQGLKRGDSPGVDHMWTRGGSDMTQVAPGHKLWANSSAQSIKAFTQSNSETFRN